jgi:competence protein ComEA
MMHSKPQLTAATRAPSRRPLAALLRTALLGTAMSLLALPGLLVPASAQAEVEAPAVAPASQTATININTADAEALARGLIGVGASRAEEIVRYRQTYGPFKAVDELMDVKGIGPSTLEKNRAVITLD